LLLKRKSKDFSKDQECESFDPKAINDEIFIDNNSLSTYFANNLFELNAFNEGVKTLREGFICFLFA